MAMHAAFYLLNDLIELLWKDIRNVFFLFASASLISTDLSRQNLTDLQMRPHLMERVVLSLIV